MSYPLLMRSLVLRHWFLILITLAVAAALTVPQLLKPFTDYFEPRRTIAFSLFLMAWTMPTRSLVEEVRQPFASAWAVLISYGLLPLSDATGQEMVTVFVPSSPTAFSGYVLIVPRDSVIELPITVEQAMRMLVSGGVINPEDAGKLAESRVLEKSI